MTAPGVGPTQFHRKRAFDMTNEVQHVVDPVRRTLVKSAALGAALPALAGGSTVRCVHSFFRRMPRRI